MTAPDAGITSALQGLPLNDCWKIGDQVQRDDQKHATVYLVVDQAGLPVQSLEAHAFELGNTQPKIREHRLRCIKRMVHRTKLEIRAQDVAIIVISTWRTTSNQAPEEDETAHEPGTLEDSPKPDRRAAQNTPHKKESARIRQKERRTARRSTKAEKHFDAADSAQKNMEISYMDEQKDFAVFLILIWILCDETGSMKEKIPTEHHDLIKEMDGNSLHESLEQYLKHNSIEFKTPAEIESYLKAKRGERIAVQRELVKLPGAEKYHLDKLGALDQDQAQYQKDSEKWQQIQSGPKAAAALHCQIVSHAKTVLPRILASQKCHIRSIEREFARDERRKGLVHDVAWYEALTHVVFPVLDAHADAVRQWEGAQIALAAFDRTITSEL